MPLSRRSQQAPRQARSFKSVLTGFGLFFCSLLICLGAIELAMRAGGAFLLWRQAGHRWNGSAASGAKPVLRILCIGESTTGPKEGNDWPHQLYEILSARRTGLDVQVINEGVGCTNSARIVAAVPNWVRLFRPHIVIAMMGINDAEWYGFSEPQDSSLPFVKLSRLRLWKLARYIYFELLHSPRAGNRAGGATPNCLYLDGACSLAGGPACEKEYQRAIELFPKAGRMYLRLAQMQESRGAVRQAAASFEKAAHYSPGFGGAHCQVAQLALRLGDRKKALAAVRESARLARSVETWDCIAGCLDALELHDQAQEARRRRTALDPDSPPPARGPNSSRLAAEFSRALIPSVRYRGLRERLIYEFLSQRAFAKAERLAFVEMAASEVPDAFQDVAHYYLKAGLPDKAATLCQIGLDLDPYWAAGHACLGWANLESKEPDYSLASRSLSRAMELLYEGAPAEFAAGMLEDILGRFRGTVKVIPESILVGILGTAWSGRQGRLSMTAAYYRHLAAYLREAGIPLVAMQYPTLRIQDLQSLLPDKAGIVFVENRDNFLRALAAEPKENIFADLFRRTWGHCTRKGNRLIAENLAESLDKAGLIPGYRPPGP